MEFRCSTCQHVGPPSEVRPTAGGAVFVCESCGQESALELGASAPAPPQAEAPTPPEPAPRQPARPSAAERASAAAEREWLDEQAFQRLLPERGEGARCRKCAHLLDPTEGHCTRCGLSRDEGERWAAGEAPWEQPPPDKEEEFEHARLLWAAFEDDPRHENLRKFVDAAREADLLELVVRRLRFWLADHPDDATAREALREVAGQFQSRIILARAHAQVSAEQFAVTTKKLKAGLVWTNVLFWGGLLIFFGGLFVTNQC